MNGVPAFAPSGELARWVRGLFIATIISLGLALLGGLMQLGLLSRVAVGMATVQDVLANQAWQLVIMFIRILAMLPTGIVFLVWFHRSHRNLPALGGRGLLYSPGWAVGGFFVPFLNFIRPAQVMAEIWHGSDPAGLERDTAPDGPAARNKLAMPMTVTRWWVLYIGPNLIATLGNRLTLTAAPTLAQLRQATLLSLLCNALLVLGALAAIKVVKQVTAWQVERNQRVLETGLPMTELLRVGQPEPLGPEEASAEPVRPFLAALDDLAARRRRGEISEEEFQAQKAALLKSRREAS